jgi:hypothetical protein
METALILVAIGFLAVTVTQLCILGLMAGGVWAFYTRFVLAPAAARDADIEAVRKVLEPDNPKNKTLGGLTGIFKYVTDPVTGVERMMPIDEAEAIKDDTEKNLRAVDEIWAEDYADGRVGVGHAD